MIIKFLKKFVVISFLLSIWVGNSFASVVDWQQLYYQPDAIIPKISFKNIDSQKGLEKLKFSKFDISRSYRGVKRPPNILMKDGYIYALDSNNTILVFSLEDRKVVKEYPLKPYENEISSGMAIYEDNLYITFGDGSLVSFSLSLGEINWFINVGNPINSAPVVNEGEVFFVANNTLYAASTTSGNILWNHIGSKAGVSLRSLFAPSIYSGYLFLGLSSSDVLVLRQEQGNLFFKSNISNTGAVSYRINPLMGDIKAPIITFNNKNGVNIIVSSNNRIVMYNLLKKEEVWRNVKLGTYSTPIILNNSILLIDTTGNLVSLSAQTGKVNWQNAIITKSKTKKRIFWYGPISFNNNLFVVNSTGELMLIDKKNGNLLSYKRLFSFKKEKVFSPPIVTDEYIAIFSSYGNLYLNKK